MLKTVKLLKSLQLLAQLLSEHHMWQQQPHSTFWKHFAQVAKKKHNLKRKWVKRFSHTGERIIIVRHNELRRIFATWLWDMLTWALLLACTFLCRPSVGNCNFSSNVSNFFAVMDRRLKFVHIFVRVCQSRALLFKLSVVGTLTFGVNRLCQHPLWWKSFLLTWIIENQ